ncbi:MAG: 4-hydroxy-3-methylbut-2-enyl diphosphate reductase [Armatimonadaceae bacterium]
MKILMAGPRGFCAGVDRAVDTVERALAVVGAPLYVKHEIIHNKPVCEGLRARGVVFTDDLNDVPEGSLVVFSAHGSAPSDYALAERRGLQVLDATCPLVTKIHLEVRKYLKKGFGIIYIGHHGHVETLATLGQAPGHLHLVTNLEEVEALTDPGNDQLIYLTQTTLSIDETRGLVNALKAKFPRLQDPPTSDICYATQNRQDAIKEVCQSADVCFVVGSQTSSNSKSLRSVAEAMGVRAYLIDGPDEITEDMVVGAKTVAVTGGASAPEDVIQSVVVKIKSYDDFGVEPVIIREEHMDFRVPQSLIALEQRFMK